MFSDKIAKFVIQKMSNSIREYLISLQDNKHAEFSSKLMPTVAPETVLGIKTPILKEFAAKIKWTDEAEDFLSDLPHKYFEENNLHAFLIERERDFDRCIELIESFLPP